MKTLLSSLTLTFFLALGGNPIAAEIVVFDLTNNSDSTVGLALGAALDTLDQDITINPNSASTATFSGITFVATATTLFGDGTAVFNASGGGAGVNTGGGGNSISDTSAAIDLGEELTLSLSFDPTLFDVALEGVGFGDGNAENTSATLAIAGGTANAFTADLDLTSTPFPLSSGDTLVFTNTSTSPDGIVFPQFDPNFDVETISLHIKDLSVVPEPSSLCLLGLGAVMILSTRERSLDAKKL